MPGNIQNVRIYNRALSATEVATLYNRPWEGTNYGTLWPYSPPVPSSATLSSDTAATSLNVDLEGWWLATDNTGTTLVDISGNGRDATLNGTNSWVADSLGTVNRFDNSVSRTSHAETANTQPDLTGGYTFSAWVKHEESGIASLSRYGAGIVLGNSSGSSDVEIYWDIRNNTGQYPQIVHNRSNGGTFWGGAATNSAKSNDNGVWVHEAVTMDGTTAKVYRNGVQIFSSAVTTVPLSTSGYKLYINELPAGSAVGGITCSMQNIRLYSRALSADEVTLLYERPFEGITYGDAFHYDPPTPASLTPLTSDSINTNQMLWVPLTETDDYASGAADISGNANNGTQSGGVLSAVSSLGGVASFNGVNSKIGVSNAFTYSSLTVSFWLRDDFGKSGDYVADRTLGSIGSYGGFSIGANGGTNRFRFFLDSGSTSYILLDAARSDILSQGVWHFITLTFDSVSQSLSAYVDGVDATSLFTNTTVGTLGSITSSGVLTIGNRPGTTTRATNSDIANVRIWSRALSSQEVWDIYQNPWLGSAYQASAAAVYYNYILRSKRFRRLS
jgi:hypothetical protein